jgi:hypothetical protein
MSTPSRILPTFAGVLTLGPGFFGVRALLDPASVLEFAHFPTPSTPTDHRLVDAFIHLYGIRNVVITLTLGSIWYRGDRKLLGAGLLFASINALVDGLVVKAMVQTGEWAHWSFLPVLWGVGGALLLG